MDDRTSIEMRAPCVDCGGIAGEVRGVNGQDTVRCAGCGRFAYNAPRVETGKRQRSVSTVHAAIKPKQRMRILERAGAKCEVCGARSNLHVGHILSVSAGLTYGLDESLLNDDENLLCLCEECNLGQGAEPMSLPLAIAVLRARVSWRNREVKA
jgi:5-methylcytosine-specific restriction endonuclease McrA